MLVGLSTQPPQMLQGLRAALVSLSAAPSSFSPSSRPLPRLTSSMHVPGEWKWLESWRSAPIDERRVWGPKSAQVVSGENEEGREEDGGGVSSIASGSELAPADLASCGALVLATADPLQKAWLTHKAFRLWTEGKLEVGMAAAPDAPGRPSRPELVPPRQVPSPKECALSPSAHMLHNLAHIELNAIDLAWDTVVRFSRASDELGRQFYADFLHVADDESRHFRWCSQRLRELGFSYGDMPAHNLLWQDCLKTSTDVRSRLAVIPMMQEARGLDAGPRLVKRLLGLNDHRSADIVRRIGQEEVAHVGVGVFHFLQICERLDVDPGDEFKDLMVKCNIELRGPFNYKARELAGMQRDWYDRSDLKGKPGLVGNNVQLDPTSPKPRDKTGTPHEGREHDIEQNAVGTSKLLEESSKGDENANAASPRSLMEGKGAHCEDGKGSSSSLLTEVYERLALVVAMEKENAET